MEEEAKTDISQQWDTRDTNSKSRTKLVILNKLLVLQVIRFVSVWSGQLEHIYMTD